MNEKEKTYWRVVIQMAQSGNQDMQENLDSENQWRKENNLPSIEEELNLVSMKDEVKHFTKEEALERAKKWSVEKDVLWAIDQEGYTPDEAIDEWDLYEDDERPQKHKEPREDMVTLVWSIDSNPVWVTRPKATYKDDPLFLELQKEEPWDAMIDFLQRQPEYQLNEGYIMEMFEYYGWDWACFVAEQIKVNDQETGWKLARLVILDEDWGEMDPEEAKKNLFALARRILQ